MRIFLMAITLIFSINSLLADEARVLRYPNSSDTQITFTHAGDVYVVPIDGGLARKVTNSKGLEMYPRFSPDGNTIAFTGEYDGNREIYTMPSVGGNPERLTYSMDISESLPERMGPDKIIMHWTNGGNKILYRGRAESWNVLTGKLYLVDTEGKLPDDLPLPKGGFAYLSPGGNKIVYNRIFREYRTWKRYRGGQADDIWIYDLNSQKLENISDNPAQDIIPMWAGNKIYYISDRTNVLNLYSYDITTKETKQITNYTDYDVKFPSLGSKHIAFQKGGYIYLMDLTTEEITKVNIEIANDYPLARAEFVNVKDDITAMDLSPEANKAVVTARGDIFTVPAKNGRIYNLTKSSGSHDREAVWSPDGKWIAYISDKSGEDEIYIIKPDGSEEIQLTDNADTYRYSLQWSPDSKKILCSDKMMELYYIDIVTKKETKITRSPYWEIRDFKWSPKSDWVAFTSYKNTMFPVVNLYSLESGKITQVTSDFFQSYSPEFSKDGKYLFFTSGRSFNGRSSAFEYTVTYNDNSKIYGLTLRNDLPNPIAEYKEDEVVIDDKKKKDKEEPNYNIEIENIKERIFELPVEPGNYGNLTATEDGKLYYVKSKTNQKPALYYYDISEKEENKVGDFSGYVISKDEKSIGFKAGSDYYIEKLHKEVKPGKGKLDLSDLEVYLDRKAEWTQIFNESWRQMKYFFYDPNMHGYDWDAMKAKYEVMLPHIYHRNDLTYVIGEMISELNVGHAYVAGGDMPKIDKIKVGLLGADYRYEKGAYKITNILEGRNWDEKTRSPLTEPGLDIKEGDYIIAIDDIKLSETVTPAEALVNKANEYVTVKYNSSPSIDGVREITVKTISNESDLRYFNWVEKNRKYVDSVTNGKIGYIHIPDMGFTNGLNEFVKYFYPQIRKEGLIIDDRYNGGGNVSPIIIERLIREITFVEHVRNQQDVAFSTPSSVFTGPMVCLINEQSMSDGDMFPYQFKRLGLGKLIGKRTWGGIIGIRGSLPLLDGSQLHKPEFANFSVDGEWILEGVGINPDIEVDNHPHQEYIGNDQQLDRAIEEILKEVDEYDGPKLPEVPPFPNKTNAK